MTGKKRHGRRSSAPPEHQPPGQPPRSQALEAELAALEAMLPRTAPAPEPPANAKRGTGPPPDEEP